MDIKNKIINHLLSVFVTNELRETCYYTDDLRNFVQEEFWGKLCTMRSGSFAEGMVNHNDTDDMFILDDFLVVEHPANIPETFEGTVLLLKPGQCEPGYVRLELHRDTHGNTFKSCSNQGGKLYLDWKKFLTNISQGKFKKLKLDVHGSALLAFNQNQKPNGDVVMCFSCPVWPAIARRELFSNQNYQNFKAENITRGGCHIVAVAHPKSKHPDLEFRISFSAAEKYLLRDWENQMKIYFLCKELFKKFFSTDQKIEKGL